MNKLNFKYFQKSLASLYLNLEFIIKINRDSFTSLNIKIILIPPGEILHISNVLRLAVNKRYDMLSENLRILVAS